MEKAGKFGVIGLFFLMLVISSCGRRDVATERAYQARKAKGDIIIGVAWPLASSDDMLKQGIEMAVDEINVNGVLGRKIRIKWGDDESSVSKGRRIAQRFADNINVTAVIGHKNSYVTIPASRIYEFSGILMLTPRSTDPELTRQGFKLIFRNIPTDEQIGEQMADFAVQKGYRQMIIYYVNNVYGEGLANAFEERFKELGGSIVDRLSYDGMRKKEFRLALTKWKEFEYDAIFLAGTTPDAARFIKEAREKEVRVPILGGDGLDSPELWEIAGEAAEGVVVGSVFHKNIPYPETRNFMAAFQKRYGTIPDTSAAQGYDALKLLAYAMKRAGTTVPAEVAQALRTTKNWPGVTGLHTFDKYGDVVGKAVVKKIVQNRKFEYLREAG